MAGDSTPPLWLQSTSLVPPSPINESSPDTLAMNGTGTSLEVSTRFNPSMAIIIVVLLSTFFFMGFLSVYVKKCVTTEGDLEQQSGWTREQGLDKAAIQALPIIGFSLIRGSRGLECCVCLAEFENDEKVRLLPKCGHCFHAECIDMWLFSHTTCPICRRNLVGDSDHPDQHLPISFVSSSLDSISESEEIQPAHPDISISIIEDEQVDSLSEEQRMHSREMDIKFSGFLLRVICMLRRWRLRVWIQR